MLSIYNFLTMQKSENVPELEVAGTTDANHRYGWACKTERLPKA